MLFTLKRFQFGKAVNNLHFIFSYRQLLWGIFKTPYSHCDIVFVLLCFFQKSFSFKHAIGFFSADATIMKLLFWAHIKIRNISQKHFYDCFRL